MKGEKKKHPRKYGTGAAYAVAVGLQKWFLSFAGLNLGSSCWWQGISQSSSISALWNQIPRVKVLQVCKQRIWNWQRLKESWFTVHQAALTPGLWASPRCLPVAVPRWQLHLADDLCETCWSWPATGGWAWTRGPSVRARYWRRQSWAQRHLVSCQFLCCGWVLYAADGGVCCREK